MLQDPEICKGLLSTVTKEDGYPWLLDMLFKPELRDGMTKVFEKAKSNQELHENLTKMINTIKTPDDEWNLLHLAAHNREFKLMEIITTNMPDVDKQALAKKDPIYEIQETPLHLMMARGATEEEAMRALQISAANVEPLLSWRSDREAIIKAISHNMFVAKCNDAANQSKEKYPALFFAAYYGSVSSVKSFYNDAKSKILFLSAKNNLEEPLLNIAAAGGNELVFHRIVMLEKQVFGPGYINNIAKKVDQDGYTCAHTAVALNNVDIIKYLIGPSTRALAATLFAVEDNSGKNVYDLAEEKGSAEVKDLLAKFKKSLENNPPKPPQSAPVPPTSTYKPYRT